jgi:ATP-dependent Clp protease protease subunit
MEIIESNSRSTIVVPIETILLSDCRTVFIEDDITMNSANEFKHTIMYLLLKDPTQPITVHISSNGGEIDAGLLIYDILKMLNAQNIEVNVLCTGKAFSIAAIIFAGAEHGHRYILPRSRVLLHEPLITGGVGGSATNIQKTAEEIMARKKDIVDLLSSDTGRSKEEIEKAISFDNYMSAQEAIDFGIADKIVNTVFIDGGQL